jgi:dihydroorotate dehydrogenase (NAD+) catalytic subunit
VSKFDLDFSKPLMNAAGSLGFAPASHGPFDLSSLGAFVTNPISLTPRSPANMRGCLNYPGGYLLHSGFPNPGIGKAIRRYSARWARSGIPIIVHLLPPQVADSQKDRQADEDGLAKMVADLESTQGVVGVELGLPPECPLSLAHRFVVAASGELPLIVRLPLERAAELADGLRSTSISAFSLGPPRGALPDRDGNLISGRLYGPGIFPVALAAVRRIADLGIPVIGAGGIYNERQAEVMLSAGAFAVQLDGVLWSLGWPGLRDR